MSIGSSSEKPEQSRSVVRVLWLVLVLNLAVSGAKLFYGVISGSASMQADGIHSAFDSFGNVVGLVGVMLASRPADEGHPYGHSKFETYASMVIGVLLVFAAYEVGSTALGKLAAGSYTAEVTWVSFAVMAFTLAVNASVTLYERREARRLHSEILRADAAHTLSDVLVSVGVIVGLAFVYAGFPQADPIMALVVTVAILHSAFEVFRTAFRTLSDHARIPCDAIIATVMTVEGIEDVHRVRTRGTESEVYCDLHIHVRPDMTVRDAHALGNQVERVVKARHATIKEVLVHIEPSDDEAE